MIDSSGTGTGALSAPGLSPAPAFRVGSGRVLGRFPVLRFLFFFVEGSVDGELSPIISENTEHC